ncbi:MAG TPA: mannose-1-phosphate guanylyltransferase/mannose-6-phosphate isomerase [Burkholderiales bacterium]|nr:mannose-1-phosphate guanylyltransferase/mannose-6-phosphate isomerase [Burkholderiales bacterium]
MQALQPIVLSGGSGTRLWPLSREHFPKPLLRLLGERSLLQETVLRLDELRGKLEIRPAIVVCNEEHRFLTADQLVEIKRPARTLLLEPAPRNTAPALHVAALEAAREGDALMLVLPADHLVARPRALAESLLGAVPCAMAGDFVVFGVPPDRAETGYGYIRAGGATPQGARAVDAFFEKPDAARARDYLASGAYSWNSGMFMMRASSWARALEAFRPDIAKAAERSWREGKRDENFLHLEAQAFRACPSESIDKAVAEPLALRPLAAVRPSVVPLDAGWSDVGNFDAVWEAGAPDAEGNVVAGDVLLEDARGTLVLANGRLVAALGLRDMVVVETPDAVMVAPKSRAQDVRALVKRLNEGSRVEALQNRKIHRPWGHYDLLHAGPGFLVKSLVINPGAAISLQLHRKRAEHWVVVRGVATVTRGEERFELAENQSTYIPVGIMHRLENRGAAQLEIVEVQSGSYLGEDDIERFSDIYKRT